MKIVIAAIQTPFIQGGAEYLLLGLEQALGRHGHQVERVSLPFRFNPLDQITRAMEVWATEDFTSLNGHQPDRVICLQFPAFYVKHPHKVLWLMHQFRAVYDLWDTPYMAEFRKQPGATELREKIAENDKLRLSHIKQRFTIAANVSSRLKRYSGLESSPIYHPPFMTEEFFRSEPEPYIFVPSRLEEAKRQELFIRAMAHVKKKITAVICGEGGQRHRLERLVEELDLQAHIKFVGRVSDQEKLGLYARSLAVFFGPHDEDYGYVTLEAMLSGKPVITCNDSGGPLEFVVADETGLVVAPEPKEIAEAIDWIQSNTARAMEMGRAGQARYKELNIGWDDAIDRLVATPLVGGR